MPPDPVVCTTSDRSMLVLPWGAHEIEVMISYERGDFPIYLDAAGARELIRQFSAAFRTIEPRDIGAVDDVDTLRLRYRLLGVAADEYAASRDLLAKALAWRTGSDVEDVLRDYLAAHPEEMGGSQ